MPDIELQQAEILYEDEIEQILKEFNNTEKAYPDNMTFYELFELQAQKVPDNIAVVYSGYECQKKMTYREFNERSNQIARVLRSKGVTRDSVVAVIAKRSIEMLAGIIGIFKAGGVYLPIDPEYPEDRIRYMLEDSGAKVLLTDRGSKSSEWKALGVLSLEDESIYTTEAGNLEKTAGVNDLAYIIYTSGSTGRPKGAMLEHAGMVNHLYAKINSLEINEKGVIAQNASQCFDISIWQFFASLVEGGMTVIYSSDIVIEPEKFMEQLIIDRVTILEVVPSFLNVMLDYMAIRYKKFDALEYIVVTGETLKPQLV